MKVFVKVDYSIHLINKLIAEGLQVEQEITYQQPTDESIESWNHSLEVIKINHEPVELPKGEKLFLKVSSILVQKGSTLNISDDENFL